jgi:hypothetical protein
MAFSKDKTVNNMSYRLMQHLTEPLMVSPLNLCFTSGQPVSRRIHPCSNAIVYERLRTAE